MAFYKGSGAHFISLLIALSALIVYPNEVLKAEDFEAEPQVPTESGAIKSTNHEEELESPEIKSQAGDSGNSTKICASQPSPTILLGGANHKSKNKIKNPSPKMKTGVPEEGMVDVEGTEFEEVDTPYNESELLQYPGPGQSIPENTSFMGEGAPSGEVTVVSLDSLIPSDNSQQQGTNDVNPQVLADWFLATLRENPSSHSQVPNLRFEKYYQTPSTVLMR
ncbi:MAG: hypothetical protein IBJ00_02710 [Alphaproteobacteria bacterium]|nr:hypothetical protein [Alphaproteobacteria bacterium]